MPETPFWEDYIQTTPWHVVRNPYVIAEIGINHNGDVELAKRIIDVAREAGCHAVKFQKRTPELCVPPHQRDVPRETPWGLLSYLDYRRKVEFGREEYDEIAAYCRSIGIQWFASAWDLKSQEFLRGYDCPYNKIASPMLVHEALLEAVAREGKTTFIGVGMSDYDQIDAAVEVFQRHKCPFILMHSVSEYPASNDRLNLRQIVVLREKYQVPIGYSGHEMTMLPGVLAVMMGAVAIERHVTINRAMWGTDQAASLEPRGLETLMNYVGQIKEILGTGERVVTEAELRNARKLRYFDPSEAYRPSAASSK
jgi:N-acetylneuraminate synthase